MPEMTVRRDKIESPGARELLVALNAEIAELYPEPGANFFNLDPWEVAPGNGAFLLAYLDGNPAGCGAVRRLGDKEAEIKMKHLQAKYPASKHGIFAAVASALGMTNQEALRTAVDVWVADQKGALIASLSDD